MTGEMRVRLVVESQCAGFVFVGATAAPWADKAGRLRRAFVGTVQIVFRHKFLRRDGVDSVDE